MSTTKTTEPAKPVTLQVNTTGAWRNIIGFDAADAQASDSAMQAAELLGQACTGAKFRIVLADGTQTCLLSWTAEGGWRQWR